MPKQVTTALNDKFVRNIGPGRYADGGGLYLIVKETGARSWLLRYKGAGGKVRDMGLGRAPGRKADPAAVGLADARARATEAQRQIKAGLDPLAEREKLALAATAAAAIKAEDRSFGRVADDLLALVEKKSRNDKHVAGWRLTFKTHCAAIRAKPVNEITRDDVLEVLRPLAETRPETCSRVRGRIERALDAAKAKGWREGENPARWRGNLEHDLPGRAKLTRGHHAALAFADVPAFVADLQGREAMAALALEFLILTAGRAGEVIGALWDEIDLVDKVWTVPAARMKAGREHRVPLSPRAVEILNKAAESKTGAYVFPGPAKGNVKDRPLSTNAFRALLIRATGDDRPAFTPHGFRSSFRDWAGEVSTFPREVAEAALAHTVGDAVELAYRRGDALAKRAKLMNAWASYLAHGGAAAKSGNVRPMVRAPKSGQAAA
jgi:integrase